MSADQAGGGRPLKHRALFAKADLRAACAALGIDIQVTTAKRGRTTADLGAAELTGIMAGTLMHCIFSIDPATHQTDHERSFYGFVGPFVSPGPRTTAEHNDRIMAMLALNAMWTGDALNNGAAHRVYHPDGRAGTTLLAARLALISGNVVSAVARHQQPRPGYTHREVAAELRSLADICDQLAGADERPDTDPEGSAP